MSRIPIRLRLALGFSLALGILLAATGIFVYEREQSDLDRQIEREISARLAGTVAILADDGDDLGDPRRDPLGRIDAAGYVQVLGDEGTVVDATPDALLGTPLLADDTIESILAGDIQTVDTTIPSTDEPVRAMAAVTRDDGKTYTAIVAASIEQRNETLESLSRLLLVGGPIAFILASILAYGMVTAALRPVERMTRQAARISGGDAGNRLPVPAANDEIADLGHTLNDMLARIEAAFERERSFVSDASHELRTPLTILKTELDFALASGRSEEALVSALTSASEETNRLVKLADDLLVLARADDGRLPLRHDEIDTQAFLERLSARFAARAAEAGRQILPAPAPGMELWADPMRMEQAMSNLVENALRYGDGPIEIEALRQGPWIDLHVRDHGPGVPADLADNAFDRFTRGDGRQAGGGAGLGLAIVAAIAEAHGGSAHLAPANGKGADAWVRIPAERS